MYAGSSNPYAPTIDLDWAYFSSNRTENPFWNWNKAYLKYCDGASFSGNNNTVTYYNGTALYFRGFKNLQAIRNSLWSQKGLNLATDVVVGGCSAGGLAVYLHLDWYFHKMRNYLRFLGGPITFLKRQRLEDFPTVASSPTLIPRFLIALDLDATQMRCVGCSTFKTRLLTKTASNIIPTPG